MEVKKAEASKRYIITDRNIIAVVEVATVIALLGYLCFPAIVNQLQVVSVWFNSFFVFVFINVLVVSIYVSCSKTTEKYIPDLYDQYNAAVRRLPDQYFLHVQTVIPTSPENNYNRVTAEVKDEKYNHSICKEIVPAFQVVKEESNCCDQVYRRTRSEKKSVEYRRTKSEKVKKTTSWRIDGLSSEEFRATVETFISEKKKRLLRDNGAVKISC